MADAEAAPVAPSPSPAPPPPSPDPPARAEAPRGLDPSPSSRVTPSSASSRRWTPRGLFGAVVRGSSTTLRLDVIRPSFGRRREMDTDYKGWGGADSRRAFETNKTFSIERLKFKATQKWRGFSFRADDALSDDAEAPSHAAPLGGVSLKKTKARLDFGFGVAFTPGGDPSRDVSSRGGIFRSGTFRPECRLKARFSADDFAPRLTARLAPEPELAVGATVPLEGPLDALLALGAPRRERERARGESEPGGDEGTRERGSGTRRRGACVRVEAVAPLSILKKTSKPFGNKGVSVTARLVRPEARGVFVSTNGLEFDFPEIPLLRGRDESIEPGDAVAARVRGAIDFPRAGLGANAGGLERVDGGDAPVRVTVRELGVKRVVRWWRRPSLSATARGDAADG